MGGFRCKHLLGLITIAALLGFGSANANAVTIKADPVEFTFIGDPFIQAPGELSVFENPPDAPFHNVTSQEQGPDAGTLFVSETIFEGSTPVDGTQYLTAGSYPFYCTIHPGMTGDLVVEGAGTATPRPKVKATILAQNLKRVKKTGTVKVKVKSSTAVTATEVTLLKGKAAISKVLKLDLKAGSAKTVSFKLNNAGRKAVKKVKKGKKLTLTATASVRFGKTIRSKRALR